MSVPRYLRFLIADQGGHNLHSDHFGALPPSRVDASGYFEDSQPDAADPSALGFIPGTDTVATWHKMADLGGGGGGGIDPAGYAAGDVPEFDGADFTPFGLTGALSGKAASSHSHAEADVTGLTSDLSGKAASSHAHAESDVTGLAGDLAGKMTNPMSAKGDLVAGGTAGAPARLPAGTNGQALIADSAQTDGLAYQDRIVPFGVVIDGMGSVVAPGVIDVPCFYNATIVGWDVYGDVSGAVTCDIKRVAYALDTLPSASMVGAGTKPNLTSHSTNRDTTVTGWTSTAITAGDVIRFDYSAITSCHRIQIYLKLQKGV